MTLADGRVVAYAAFVAPALLAQSTMNGAISETIFNVFFKLNFEKVYDAILATPLGIGDIALGELMWAVATRADPERDYRIMTHGWSSALDPLLPPEKRAKRDFTNSRVIIDATRPYSWRNEFPLVNTVSPALRKQVLEKWASTFEDLRSAVKPPVVAGS